jgi:hypothetical protein
MYRLNLLCVTDAGAWGELCTAEHRIWRLLWSRKDRRGLVPSHLATPGSTEHPLSCAAKHGHMDVCSLLLQQGVPAEYATRALCSAAAAGCLPIMQLIIDQVPGVREAPEAPVLGDRPLVCAARGGHIPAVQLLLDQGADLLNRRGTPFSRLDSECWGTSVLKAAAEGRAHEMLQFLLGQGVQWHGEYHGSQPWQRLCNEGTQ